jgi:PKD repeat protein
MVSRRDLGALLLFLSFCLGTSIHGFSQSASITADFGSRATSLPRVPSDMFGIVPGGLAETAGNNLVGQAGFTRTRRMAQIPQVYATSTPNWSSFDGMLRQVRTAGMHPIIVMSWTPSWLQPSPNPCLGTSKAQSAPPRDVQQWAEIAASYVAHVDQAFPGLVQDFEIWNEPDVQQTFCVADNSDATRLQTYLSLYAAAASAMHAQAARDGVTIRVGGPTMCRLGLASEWISALVNNPQTAPNVDFVSYHFYLTNGTVPWSTFLSLEQSSRGTLATYQQIAGIVKNGSQPNAASTPIYISEYNNNASFLPDCCRNDPTYAPVLNSLVLTHLLNASFANANVPAQIYYFAGSVPPFCVAGAWDASMDCSASAFVPYPQYYAFQLFSKSNYLGLASGGHMAASVVSSNVPAQVATTAFFTESKDVITIVNPTSQSLSQVSIAADNAGLTSPVATAYLLNRNHGQISAWSPAISSTGGGQYTITADIPALSVVAIALSGGSSTSSSSAPPPPSSSSGSSTPQPPKASLIVEQPSGSAPLTVTVNSSGSHAVNGAIATRTIYFGDRSAPAKSVTASHTYAHAGTYGILLIVTDHHGLTSKARATVTVALPPALPPDSDFAFSAMPKSTSGNLVTSGNSSVFTVVIKPMGSVSSPVSLSCSDVPVGLTCSFAPSTIIPGTRSASSVLTIKANAPLSFSWSLASSLNPFAGWWMMLPGLAVLGDPRRAPRAKRQQWLTLVLLLVLLLSAMVIQMGCAGLGPTTTAVPSAQNLSAKTITVRAVSSNYSHSIVIRAHAAHLIAR